MSIAPPIINELPAINLEQLDTTWVTARRYDTKFILERNFLNDFLMQRSSMYAALEVGGARAFAYETQYFDTPDLLLYWDHAQRRQRRIKVRTRRYVESNRNRLEIKAKLGNGQIQKTTFEGIDQINQPEISLIEKAIVDLTSRQRLVNVAKELVPVAVTTFYQTTLINQINIERITIDTMLGLEANFSRTEMHLDLVRVEIKSPQRMSETTRELRKSGLRPTTFSKYGAAIETTLNVRPRVHNPSTLSSTMLQKLTSPI